jgi:hypothetical protein
MAPLTRRAFTLAMAAATARTEDTATVIGAYPTFPATGPLEGKSPAEQARWLASLGVNLAGGVFRASTHPAALRNAGIRTFGLVVIFQGEDWWKKEPSSRPVMADGNPLFRDRWYAGLCPNQPWLRQRKLDEIGRMLKSGRYDAINLDFIRYPVHWEVPEPRIPDTCYCPVCLGRFAADTGIAVPAGSVSEKAAALKTRHPEAWYRWRADRITAFCDEVRALRDRLSPQTLITLAAVPWRPEDYDNAIHRVVGQDFAALARSIDVFNPMSYHVLNRRPVAWIGEINAWLRQLTGKPVWPFVIFDRDHELDAAGWQATFAQALSNGATGLIAFPFKNVPQSRGFEALREIAQSSRARPSPR